MTKAHVTRSTDEIDAVLALQIAEPGPGSEVPQQHRESAA